MANLAPAVKFIQRDTASDGDIEGLFLTEHGNGDDFISQGENFFTNAFDFVADDEGAGKVGFEGGEIFGFLASF